jgi:hypothetical protein
MNEQVDYQVKKPGAVTKFLWWCAGADKEILKYSSYSDHVKYAGIGGVVLATGFLAAISMGFAMHTIFGDDKGNGNWLVTIPIALAWSLIVFNLDRFIVSSTGKGDGESSISGKEFLNALPRLLMATLLGITIAAPLETVIFDTEIQREWKLSMKQLSFSRSYDIEAEYKLRMNAIDELIHKDSSALSENEKRYNELQNKINDLQAGVGEYTGKQCNRGMTCPTHFEIYKGRDIALSKLNESKSVNDSLTKVKSKLQDEKVKKIKKEIAEIETSAPGFLDKLMMLERLSADGKTVPKIDPTTSEVIKGKEIEIYGSAFWAIWLVRLLFMIVEIAPVILKLMLIKGPYDYMSENVNQILETKQGISIYHMKDEHSQLHKLKRNHNPERIIAIIEHQNEKETENAKEAISAFAEKEKEQIRKNPDDFIQPTNQ